MGDLVFSSLVLTKIFFYLDRANICQYALCNKDCYAISRRYGSKYLRWVLTTEERLNHVLYDKLAKTWLQYVEAVAIPPKLSFWSALVIIGQARMTDVQLVLEKSDEVNLHTVDIPRFDSIKIFSIKYNCRMFARFWIDGLPLYLEKFAVLAPLRESKEENDMLCVVADFPNTLTHLHLEKEIYGIQHRSLPASLVSVRLSYPKAYDHKPILHRNACLNLKYLSVESENPKIGISIGNFALFPKLEYLNLSIVEPILRTKRADVNTKNTPMLKTVIGTQLNLMNDGNLKIKSQTQIGLVSKFEFY